MPEITTEEGYEAHTAGDIYTTLYTEHRPANEYHGDEVEIVYNWKHVRIPVELVPGLAKWLLDIYGYGDE